MQSIFDTIIIGAGPAGISFAVEAIHSGIDTEKILILEKENQHNFSIRKYYPENKLVTANYKGVEAEKTGVLYLEDCSKSEALNYFDNVINQYQLDLRYLQQVKEIITMKNGYYRIETLKEAFVCKVVIIASGILGKPNSPSYKIPESIKNKIHFSIPSEGINNKKVLVVGGGDSASEYAQSICMQNEVLLSYRRSSFYRMTERNLEYTESLIEKGHIKSLLGTDIAYLEDLNGQIKVIFKEQEPILIDHIIYAIGGSDPKEFLSSIGINMRGESEFVDDHYESKREGVFIIGDLSAGKKGGSINYSFGQAKKAIREVCKNHLDCKI